MDTQTFIDSFEFRFGAAGIDNARRVTEELLAHLFDCKPLEIYTGKMVIPETASAKFSLLRKMEALAERIEAGEPLQYVIGQVDFWGLTLTCDPRALIPRPETELLVEEVLSSALWQSDQKRIADVGTGSGCIVLTLATQRPGGTYIAIDPSEEALSLARENAETLQLTDRITFKQQSLLDGFSNGSLDGVVANLPYIATDDWKALAPSVRDHEPQSALNSGPTGMELIEDLALQARTVLAPGGWIFLEFGFDQGNAVKTCLEKLGYTDIVIKHDLAGLDRMAIARTPAG
jgi:release factor glutamine methyltransferase